MTAIVVLGMHHSGTSLVASMLDAIGVYMGKEMLGPNEHNPWGHFEDVQFLKLNKTILSDAGGSWFSPPSPRKIKDAIPHKAVVKLISDRKREQSLWGWKDPRNCLTLAVYHPHIQEDVKYIYVRRDPVSIAASLKKWRQEQDVRWGKLIKTYKTRADNFFRENWPVDWMPVQYEHLMDPDTGPAVTMGLILFLGLDINLVDTALERIHRLGRLKNALAS